MWSKEYCQDQIIGRIYGNLDRFEVREHTSRGFFLTPTSLEVVILRNISHCTMNQRYKQLRSFDTELCVLKFVSYVKSVVMHAEHLSEFQQVRCDCSYETHHLRSILELRTSTMRLGDLVELNPKP